MKQLSTFILSIFVFIFQPSLLKSQTYLMPVTGDTTITTCSGTIYDDGGSAGNYSDNANGIISLIPSEADSRIRLTFNHLDLSPDGDTLNVYNGTYPDNLSIGSYTYLTDSVITSTAANGSLTLNLFSDATGNASGFFASITCISDTVQTNLGISNVTVNNEFIAPGSPVNLIVQVYNYSEIIVENTNIGFYLSTDNHLDTDDQLLSSYTMQYFAPNYIYSFYYNLAIPSEASLGEHFIIVKIDDNDHIAESDEEDNIYSVNILIEEDPKDFYFVSAYIYEGNQTTAGGIIRINSDFYYIGQTYVDTLYTAVFLSKDSILEATDTLLAQRLSRYIYPNGYVYNSFTFYMPENIDTGDYYLIINTDYQNRFDETDETNNLASLPVKINPRYANLRIYDLNLENTILYRNINNSAQYVLKNLGNYIVKDVKTAFYLSKDYTLDESDIYIMTDNMSQVSYDNYSYKTVNLNFKNLEGIQNDLYYLILKTDATDSIEETNEDNNTYYIPVFLTDYSADIELTGIVSNNVVMAFNYGYTITTTLKNLGPMEITSFYTDYYLSKDSVLNIPDNSLPTIHDDIYMGRSYHYSLPANHLTSQSLPLYLYDTVAAGTYYLIGIADQEHNVDQVDSTNNIFITELEVGEMIFDLEISFAELPVNIVKPGTLFLVNSIVKSNSNNYYNYPYVNCYISNDTIKDSNDTYIFSNNITRMAPGETRNEFFSMSSPPGFAEGDYYLLICIDANNSLTEINEANNLKYIEISFDNSVIPEYISPELSISGLSLEKSFLSAGSRLYVDGKVINSGTSVSNVMLAYYLSEDTILDVEDLNNRLYEHQIYNLSTGTIYSIDRYFNLPATLTKGDYYIIGKVDDYNIAFEDNELDNIAFAPVRISDPVIDLTIGFISLSPSIFLKGSKHEIGFTVQNSGTSTASSTQTGIFLLSYNDSDTLSIPIGTYNIGSISAGNDNYYYTNISIPDTIEEGLYFLQIKADNLNEIQESNENNNCSKKVFGIMNPDIDYRIDNIMLENQVIIAGNYINLNVKVYNDGFTESLPTSIGYYLSTDTLLDPENDIFIYQSSVAPLSQQSSTTKYINYLQLPNDLTPGNYRLYLVIDYLSEITEKSEDNNISFIEFSILPPFVDLSVENLTLTNSTVTQGEQLYINCNIRNKGNSTATSSYTGFYISPDTILDNNDLLLGYEYTYSLSSNDYSYEYYYANVPSDYDTGQYYILVAADYQKTINESDETNNVAYKSFKIIEPNIDLEISVLSVNNNSMPAGSYCYINYTIRNNGLTNCGGSTTRFYLSKDSVLNPLEDSYLGQYSNYSIGAGGYDYNSASINIPATIKKDDYYLIAVADMLDVINETNELNNNKRILISISESFIDLTITNASISSNSYMSGDYAYISFYLRNYGNIASTSGYLAYYISKDSVIDENDVYITESYFYSLGGNDYSYISRNISIPYIPESGDYYLIIKADNSNQIQEKFENNNLNVFRISIFKQYMQTDIRGGWANYNGYNFYCGDTLECEFYFTTNRIDSIEVLQTAYYLSNDINFDEFDILLCQVEINAPFTDTIISTSVDLLIPDTVNSGMYYVLGIADAFNQIAERDELNNTYYFSIQVNEKIIDNNKEHPETSSYIYPNPVTSELNLFNNSEYQNIKIYNASGAQVLNYLLFDNLNTIDVSDLLPGIYTVVLSNGMKTMNIQIVKVRN